MGIMSTLFGAAPTTQPASMPAPSQISTPNNPNLPQPAGGEGATPSATPAAPASPMDGHATLWQNDATNKGVPAAPLFDIDPAKFQSAIQGADFTTDVPADIMQKALAGDVAAFSAAMNGVARQAFSHQTMATTKLIEQALDRRSREMEARMPELVRKANVSEQLQDNPMFQHEATRPLMDALQQQLQTKFPKATASQIAEQARNYVSNFAKLAGGNAPADALAADAAKDNWDGF